MKILELIHFVDSRVHFTYYPNSFPIDSEFVPDFCGVVKITSGFPVDTWVGTKRPSFQIRVRGDVNGDATCEAKAYEIHAALTNLRDVMIGNDSVVQISAMNSEPMYLGDDENNRPIYSMNFNTTVRPG